MALAILVPMMAAKQSWMRVLSLLAAILLLAPGSPGEKQGKPLVIRLEPFGIPRSLFGGGGPLLCLHQHAAGTRLFWLDETHLFVAFTTIAPCTFHAASEPSSLRGIVFDTTTGMKIASRDWPVSADLSVFAGPGQSVVIKDGSTLQFLDLHLKTMDSGELDQTPKGLWSTPGKRTLALLSGDGREYEFYGADPLRMLDTISLDATDEVRAIADWVAGDERIAGSRCTGKSIYSCNKIVVLTPDAKFLDPEGAPWSYQEPRTQEIQKPVSLQPVGFLDATHLIITREPKNFLESAQLLIVTPNGSRIQLPPVGELTPAKIAGVAGQRFGMQLYALGACADCIVANFFAVAEPDSRKFLFEKRATPYMSAGELSPDGKWMAILDNSAVTLYPIG